MMLRRPKESSMPLPSSPAAKRPGRRARHAAETRERLFRCALGLFAQRGFSDTTVEDITEAADVGKGTFFNYFPSKEHILAAFGDMQISKLEKVLGEAKTSNLPMRQIVARLTRLLADAPGRSP